MMMAKERCYAALASFILGTAMTCLMFQVGYGPSLREERLEAKRVHIALFECKYDQQRAVRVREKQQTPPDYEKQDRDNHLTWKVANLTALVDTACVNATGVCGYIYKHKFICERSVQLWTSLARATGWAYDPWAAAPWAVNVERLRQWVGHPGFAHACM